MDDPLWTQIDPAHVNAIRPLLAEKPVRVAEIARVLDVPVVRTVLPPSISGLIKPCVTSRSGFEIRVNKYDSVERQRFTVAHELAHFLLHRKYIGSGVIDNTLYRSNLTSRKEVEANRLAADIIMPAALVRNELDKLGTGLTDEAVDELASTFRVSSQAMQIRVGSV